MIFLTVGTQLSFDRLVRAVDQWAGDRGRTDIFGQIANPGVVHHRPQHFDWADFLSPAECRAYFEKAEMIVAHAGMGSIIGAMTYRKPILIMPRRAHLHEHRNDHQFGTAQRFEPKPGVFVAMEEADIPVKLDAVTERMTSLQVGPVSDTAEDRLIMAIRACIFETECTS